MDLNKDKVFAPDVFGVSNRLVLALELLGVEASDPINFQVDLVTAIHNYSGAMQNDELAAESQCYLDSLVDKTENNE